MCISPKVLDAINQHDDEAVLFCGVRSTDD